MSQIVDSPDKVDYGYHSGMYVCHTLLGQSKKLWGRKKAILHELDGIHCKNKMQLLVAQNPPLLADVRASPRARLVLTHTFVIINKLVS